jgi:hypothetical protein
MACKAQHKKISEIPTRQKMHLELEQTDKENITKSILEKYAKASFSMEGSFRYGSIHITNKLHPVNQRIERPLNSVKNFTQPGHLLN